MTNREGLNFNTEGRDFSSQINDPQVREQIISIRDGLDQLFLSDTGRIQQFQEKVVENMGISDYGITDEEERQQRVKDYFSNAGVWCREQFPQEDFGIIKTFMKEQGNNVGLLMSAILFNDEPRRKKFLTVMSGIVQKKAMAEGIRLRLNTASDKDLIDNAMSIGQNYPLFLANRERQSMLSCLDETIKEFTSNELENKEDGKAGEVREKIVEDVERARPENLEKGKHTNEIRYMLYLQMSNFGAPDEGHLQEALQGIDENDFDEIVWELLDPDKGVFYSDTYEELSFKYGFSDTPYIFGSSEGISQLNRPGSGAVDRQRYLSGLCHYIVYNKVKLTPDQKKLIGLALTHPLMGLGNKNAYEANAYVDNRELLYLTALVSQDDREVTELVEEHAVNNEETLLEEVENGVLKVNRRRFLDTLSLLTLGLNNRDPRYFEKYFELIRKFELIQIATEKEGSEKWDLSTILSLSQYERRASQKYPDGYATSYSRIYGYRKIEDVSIPLLKRGAIGMDPELSSIYISNSINFCLDDPENYFDRFGSIVATRKDELDFGLDNSLLVLEGAMRAKELYPEKDPKFSYYSDNYEVLRGCVKMIGGEEVDKLVFTRESSDNISINWEELEKVTVGYRSKREKTEQIALALAAGDVGGFIKKDLKSMEDDPDFIKWKERTIERFKELSELATSEVHATRETQYIYATQPDLPYEVMEGYKEYLNAAYQKIVGDTRGNVNFAGMLRLYRETDFTFSKFEELVSLSAEIFDSSASELFNPQRGKYLRGFIFPDNYEKYSLEGDNKQRVIEDTIPQVRSFIEEKILTLEETHPVVMAMTMLGVKREDLLKELTKYEEDLQRYRTYEYGYNRDSYSGLIKTINMLYAGHAISEIRKANGISVETSDRDLVVEGATSPLLEAEIGKLSSRGYGSNKIRANVVPVSQRLSPGRAVLLSGPNGSGKSTYMNAMLGFQNAFYYGIPTAMSVSIPNQIERPSEIGSLDIYEWSSRSLFQNMSQERASALSSRRKVDVSDEGYMGCPAEYRIPLVTADLITHILLGDFSEISTHQAPEVAELLIFLGYEDAVDFRVINPQTHEADTGIGRSYGTQMVEMQGGTTEYLSLVKDLSYAHEQSFPDLDVTDHNASIEAYIVPENDNKLDELSIESSELEACLRTLFSEVTHGANLSTLFIGFTEYLKTANPSDRDIMEGIIERFENIPIEQHVKLIDALKKLVNLDNKLVAFSKAYSSAGVFFEEGKSRATYSANVEMIGEIMGLRSEGYVTELSQEELSMLSEFFPEGFVDNILGIIQKINEVNEARNETPDFSKKVEDLSSDYEKDKFIRYIQNRVQRNPEFEVEVNAAIENSDMLGLCVLFDKMYKSDPKEFFGKIEGYEADSIMKWLTTIYKPYYLKLQEKFNTDATDGKPDVIDNLHNMVAAGNSRDQLALLVAFASRQDSPLGFMKLTKPAEQMEEGDGRFPIAYQAGNNLSLIGSLGGSSGYKPQNLYFDNDTVMHAEKESKSIYLTGIQGGGKTETLRLTSQMLMFDWLFKRVPARKAVVFSRPDKIISVIKTPKTEGVNSSFMGEAKRLASVIKRVSKGTVVLYDEPANGTAEVERESLIAGMDHYVRQTGGSYMITNHANGVYNMLSILGRNKGVDFETLGFTLDKREDYGFKHNTIAGAESFQIAEEMGVPTSVVELARYLHQVGLELEEHKKRLLY